MASICKQKQAMLLCIMAFNAVTKYWHCIMSFSDKSKTVIKIYNISRIWFAKDTDGIFEDKLQQEKTGHFTKKIWEMQSTDQRHEATDLNTRITEENRTTVNELLDPVGQENQQRMYFSTHQILKEMVLTESSIVQVIHCDLTSVIVVYC